MTFSMKSRYGHFEGVDIHHHEYHNSPCWTRCDTCVVSILSQPLKQPLSFLFVWIMMTTTKHSSKRFLDIKTKYNIMNKEIEVWPDNLGSIDLLSHITFNQLYLEGFYIRNMLQSIEHLKWLLNVWCHVILVE